jgi:hypothetical protein
MKKETVWRRLLIFTSGIAFLVIPLLIWILILVKKDTTGISAEEDIWVTHVGLFAVTQIFIFSALIRTSKGLLIASGIVSMLSGLLYLHLALVFIFTEVHNMGILFMVSAGCNFVVALFSLILRLLCTKINKLRLI